jgi:hypothetical protein
MVATFWILGLGALGALLFWLRWLWERKARSRELASVRQKAAARDAELDQVECLELENLLLSGTTSRRPAADEKPAARGGGAAV